MKFTFSLVYSVILTRKPGIIKLTVSLLDWHFASYSIISSTLYFSRFKCGKKIDKIDRMKIYVTEKMWSTYDLFHGVFIRSTLNLLTTTQQINETKMLSKKTFVDGCGPFRSKAVLINFSTSVGPERFHFKASLRTVSTFLGWIRYKMARSRRIISTSKFAFFSWTMPFTWARFSRIFLAE